MNKCTICDDGCLNKIKLFTAAAAKGGDEKKCEIVEKKEQNFDLNVNDIVQIGAFKFEFVKVSLSINLKKENFHQKAVTF